MKTCLILALLCLTNLNAGIENAYKKAENKSDLHKMEGIDFIYMINLDPRPEKYERTMNALRPYNINPYRFSAVNGWELSFEILDELGIVFEPGMQNGPISSVYRHVNGKEYHSFEIMKEPGIAYYAHSLSRGAIGCLLSHLSIMKDAYDSGYNTIWIMEDDIRVVSNPHELSSLMQILDTVEPDWDILFTDNEIKGASGPVPCTVIRPRPLVQVQPLDYYLQRKNVHKDIVKIGMRFGSASMIIRRSGMKKLLDYFETYKVYFPYDIDYFYVPGINLFALNRDIVTNIVGGESDNGGPTYLDKAKK
ncbi:MAG TPA: glycosyltransferase family 25 protein [Rhabdochlamydiaceae bacterium]|jgi:GR25 family glycosyltransferase involved in LPS biosynthesis|nr:glycosyltransferase family 25 protein [Rhabdochlamydiaceae bacterium]